MSAMASQITSVSIVYLTVSSGAYQIQHQIFLRHRPLCGEFTGDMKILRKKGQ